MSIRPSKHVISDDDLTLAIRTAWHAGFEAARKIPKGAAPDRIVEERDEYVGKILEGAILSAPDHVESGRVSGFGPLATTLWALSRP